jgi:FG-GAP repeat
MGRRFEGRRQPGAFCVRGSVLLLGCLAVALTLGAALLAASAPLFGGPRNHTAGGAPYSVNIGDLNGDGKPDLVTANLRVLAQAQEGHRHLPKPPAGKSATGALENQPHRQSRPQALKGNLAQV